MINDRINVDHDLWKKQRTEINIYKTIAATCSALSVVCVVGMFSTPATRIIEKKVPAQFSDVPVDKLEEARFWWSQYKEARNSPYLPAAPALDRFMKCDPKARIQAIEEDD